MVIKIVPRVHPAQLAEKDKVEWLLDGINRIEKRKLVDVQDPSFLGVNRIYSVFEECGGDPEQYDEKSFVILRCYPKMESKYSEGIEIALDDTVEAFVMNENGKTIDRYRVF